MRRPLISVVFFYAAGIVLGDQWPVSLTLLFLPAFLALPFCLCQGRLGTACLGCLLVLMGWINQVRHTGVHSPHDLRAQLRAEAYLVTLQGRLHTAPVAHAVEPHVKRIRSLATLDSTAYRTDQDWMPARGRVLVITQGQPKPDFFPGREVEIIGVLRPPRGAATEGGYDSRALLARRGIYHELDVGSVDDWKLMEEGTSISRPPIAITFRSWAQRVLAQGLPAEDDALRLTWAMVLGWKTALTDEVAEPFRRAGTMHVFAISGLHIGMIALILVSICRVVQVPRAACIVIVVPLLWFYTAATGWQSSAVRATIMTSIVVAGWSLARPVDLLNSLAGAALVILIWDPQQLFQAGFQLSFSVVLSIGLLLPPLGRCRDRLLRYDPLLPDDLRSPWHRRVNGACRHVLTSLAISLAAWLGSIPWMAWYFQIFTPITLVANLVMIPLAAGVLASSLTSLAFGAWWVALSGLNHSAWLWMTLMARTSELAAALPGAWFHVPAPPAFALVAYYLLLVGMATGWLFRPRRLAAAGSLLLVAVMIAVAQSHRQRHDLRITVLGLRGGDSLLFEGNHLYPEMLIDTGDASAAEFSVSPFLRTRGIHRLPQLLFTHGDVRHIGGGALILDDFEVETVITSAVRFRSPYYRELVRRLETDPDHWRQVGRGAWLGPWEVLHPAAADRFSRADDNVIVLRGTFHGIRVLLCSDLGRIGQRTLAERESNLGADLLVAGMPGPDEPLGNLFLDAIQPALIVISSGEYPASERPSPALRERLAARAIPVLFTLDHGAITITLRPDGWEVQTMDGRRHMGPKIVSIPSELGVAPRARGN
jgi:competence protein ComEC